MRALHKAVRIVSVAVLVGKVVVAYGQNVPIQPLWTSNYNYSEGEARFSRDGSLLVASGRYGKVFFRTTDWKAVGTRSGTNTWFVPTDDGKSLFTPEEGLTKVDITTGAREYLADNELFYHLALSRDGAKLGWWNVVAGKAAVTVFDVATKTRKVVKFPNLESIHGIEFLPDNNSFVTSGPNVFSYDGVRPYKKTNYAKGFAVSADGTFAYQLMPESKLAKFKVADGKQIWIKTVPDVLGEFVGLTADGKGVVLNVVTEGNSMGVAVHKTETGDRVGTSTKTDGFLRALSPTTNQAILSYQSAERYLKVIGIDSTTGVVSPVLDLTSAGAGTRSRRLPFDIGAVPMVADVATHWFKVFIRRATDGQLAKTITLPTNAVFGIAPDGSSYAVFIDNPSGTNDFVRVYRYSDGKEIASYRSTVEVTRIDYSTPTRLMLHSDATFRVMDMVDTKLNLVRSFPSSTYLSGCLSLDGTRFAGRSANSMEMKVVDVAGGNLLAKIDMKGEASQGTMVNMYFTATGKLAIEGGWAASGSILHLTRIYDFTTTPIQIVGKGGGSQYGYQRVGDVSANGRYIAMVTSDNLGYEQIRITIYTASTGKIYKELTVPFSQVGMLPRVRFSTSGLYLHVQTGDELGMTLFTIKA